MSRKLLTEKLLPFSDETKRLLKENDIETVYFKGPTQEDLLASIDETIDAVIAARVDVYYGREFFDRAANLKILTRFGVGYENFDVDCAKERGIMVTYAPMSNINAVAEHAMYFILALAKNGPYLDDFCRSWTGRIGMPKSGKELSSCTLGIVGCGRIGTLTARKARHGFNMRVLGYDAFLPPERFDPAIERVDDLDVLLHQSDFVSIHIPAGEDNRGFFNMDKFRAMKPTSYFINVARGSLVNEGELAEALRTGVIAGAGVDVFQTEPVPAAHPLLGLDNVILSPHSAANTPESMKNAERDTISDVVAALNGSSPKYELTGFGRSPRL